jgi:hypothetical protein
MSELRPREALLLMAGIAGVMLLAKGLYPVDLLMKDPDFIDTVFTTAPSSGPRAFSLSWYWRSVASSSWSRSGCA